MMDSIELTLCQMQGHLFELSAEEGFESETFVKTFMNSATAEDLDKPFHHMQWAGEKYLLSRLKEENANLLRKGVTLDNETLYWSGYLYRAWHFYTGESSREIYRQAPVGTMRSVYLPYHTMSVEAAIDRLKETFRDFHKSGRRSGADLSLV